VLEVSSGMVSGNGEMARGAALPNFELPDAVSGELVRSDAHEQERSGLVVAFLCNHCPYVKHIRQEFAEFARWCASVGVGVVAISSNDEQTHPQDGPKFMAKEAASAGYEFPYLFDETQEVAKSFGAACTPDLYLFDAAHKLTYHGQFDASRPNSGIPVTGKDLREAVSLMLAKKPPIEEQRPSVGCNIKWRSGNAPSYA